MFIIKVENLSKMYYLTSGITNLALDNISFKVKKGEILGIIGKSGSGKTTLLRIIRGIESFDRGRVQIENITVTPESSRDELEKIKDKSAFQYQRSFGLWSLTTVENIMKRIHALKTGDETIDLPPEDSREYEELKAEAMPYLELVGLEHKWYQYAHTLSGGEKQRLVLARQLVLNPRILLLDEPLSMASPDNRVDIIDLIRKMRDEQNMTVLLVSHLSEIHEKLSDRLILLEEGRVKFDGDVTEGLSLFLSHLEDPEPLKPLKSKSHVFSVKDIKKKYYHYNLKQIFELKISKLIVNKGEILGIIGPSGSGKTVLIRLLSGLELPNEGEIIYHSSGLTASISELGLPSVLARQKIGLIRQEFDLTYYASILDIILSKKRLISLTEEDVKKVMHDFEITDKGVDFLIRLMQLPREAQQEIITQMDLSEDELTDFLMSLPYVPVDHRKVRELFYQLDLPDDILDRRSFELSGGEKIRVAIGIEMAMNPDILILDEPFADLDPITTRKLCNLLKKLNHKTGVTMIIVSHNRTALKETAHRVVKVEAGNLIGEVNDDTELQNLLLSE